MTGRGGLLRLLGWAAVANVAAVGLALLGSPSAAAAREVFAWCRIG